MRGGGVAPHLCRRGRVVGRARGLGFGGSGSGLARARAARDAVRNAGAAGTVGARLRGRGRRGGVRDRRGSGSAWSRSRPRQASFASFIARDSARASRSGAGENVCGASAQARWAARDRSLRSSAGSRWGGRRGATVIV